MFSQRVRSTKVLDGFTNDGLKSLDDKRRNVNDSLILQIPSPSVKTTSKIDSDVSVLSRSKSVSSAVCKQKGRQHL